MDTLINRTVEEFLRLNYGESLVESTTDELSTLIDTDGRRGRVYALRMLEQAAFRLSKPTQEMLEDLGGWFTRIEAIRRLLRFSGRDFSDFVLRLDEMPSRAHLILPNLQLPAIEVTQRGQSLLVRMTPPDSVWRHILVGTIRGMADDYGALCLISGEAETIHVNIWDISFTEGRAFFLDDATEGMRP